jgi:hypothetical protein
LQDKQLEKDFLDEFKTVTFRSIPTSVGSRIFMKYFGFAYLIAVNEIEQLLKSKFTQFLKGKFKLKKKLEL